MVERSDCTAGTVDFGVAGQLVARKEIENVEMRIDGQLSKHKSQTATRLKHLRPRGLGLAPRCSPWAEDGFAVELERICISHGLHLVRKNQVGKNGPIQI
jgi:hypothetical protein